MPGSGVKKLPSSEWEKEGVRLNLRRIALSMLIAITLISGLSLAEDANVSINESEIAPAEGVDATANATDAESSASEDVATQTAQSLEGSWILTMDDARVSMVLYQSGAILFGAANSDSPSPGTPWSPDRSPVT